MKTRTIIAVLMLITLFGFVSQSMGFTTEEKMTPTGKLAIESNIVPPAMQPTIIKMDDKASKQLRKELIGSKKNPGIIPGLKTSVENTGTAANSAKTAADSAKTSADAAKKAIDNAVKYGGIGLVVLILVGLVGLYLASRNGKKIDVVGEIVENVPLDTAKLIQKEVLIHFTVDGKAGTFKAPIVAGGAIQVLHLRKDGTPAYFFKERDARNSLVKTLEVYFAGTASVEQKVAVEQVKASGKLEIG